MTEWQSAAIIGVAEGLTEFLPVSSTGHLILLGELLNFNDPGESFKVMIQLGAILAIAVFYFRRIFDIVINLPTSRDAQRISVAICCAFLPAAVIGVIFHHEIKTLLFSPIVVGISLTVGGVVLLIVDRLDLLVRVRRMEDISFRRAIAIGFCQALAMIPGVSRSGATITGSVLMGLDRKIAAEFSFFLALPTMFGAFVFDLASNTNILDGDRWVLLAIGMTAAFIAAMAVVKPFLYFIHVYGLAPFGYYRIVAGTIVLAVFW